MRRRDFLQRAKWGKWKGSGKETADGQRKQSPDEKGHRAMKRRMLLVGALVALLWATPARADTGIIVRTTGGLSALNILCAVPTVCTVVGGALDGTLGQVFLITTPLPLTQILPLLQRVTGFVGAEVDQVLNLVGLAN